MPENFPVGSQFSKKKKKKVLAFVSGSETHYRNSSLPPTTVVFFNFSCATCGGIPTVYVCLILLKIPLKAFTT